MVSCSVGGCKNNSNKGTRMCYIPRNPSRSAIWLKNAGITKKKLEGMAICEFHFTDDQWEVTRIDGKKKLKVNAVPTVFGESVFQVEKKGWRKRGLKYSIEKKQMALQNKMMSERAEPESNIVNEEIEKINECETDRVLLSVVENIDFSKHVIILDPDGNNILEINASGEYMFPMPDKESITKTCFQEIQNVNSNPTENCRSGSVQQHQVDENGSLNNVEMLTGTNEPNKSVDSCLTVFEDELKTHEKSTIALQHHDYLARQNVFPM